MIVEARHLSKKYELQRHRSIMLRDLAKLAMGHRDRAIFWALRDASFQIRKGQTIGIIGPNGAGKSTLLSLIAKTSTPTSGTIRVDGRVSALLELGAGFHADFTGRENVYINGTLMGLTRKQVEERLPEIIAFSEIGPFIDEPARNYSSGMLARLGFAVATSVDAEILIVDETLSVGDAAFQEKSFQRILDFQRRGCTIILVSHSPEIIETHCDQALLLIHGTVAAAGPAKEICRKYLERTDLTAPVSPYETERVSIGKTLLSTLLLSLVLAAVVYAGLTYVLAKDVPVQRPPAAEKFER